MSTPRNLELPDLLVAEQEITTSITHEEYTAAAHEFAEVQDRTVQPTQLWMRLMGVRTGVDEKKPTAPPYESLREGRAAWSAPTAAERFKDVTINARKLYYVLRAIHDKVASQQEYLEARSMGRERGEHGVILPTQAGLYLPQGMGQKGLVVGTYAMNNHLRRT